MSCTKSHWSGLIRGFGLSANTLCCLKIDWDYCLRNRFAHGFVDFDRIWVSEQKPVVYFEYCFDYYLKNWVFQVQMLYPLFMLCNASCMIQLPSNSFKPV